MLSINQLGGTRGLVSYLATARSTVPETPVAATASAAASGEKVSLSAAAMAAQKAEAAAKSAGIALPQSVRDWFDKDFSEDVLSEARSRLAAIRESGPLGAEGPLGLPLLPESQALLDDFRAEMRSLSAGGHSNMDETASARYNLLLNLSMRVQMQGWRAPMASEADAQQEFDVANAMAALVRDDPTLAPPADTETEAGTETEVDKGVETPLDNWSERWQAEGLEMPSFKPLETRSLWLQMADAAGFSESEFMTAARELASRFDGHALTRQVEQLIAGRYAQKLETAG